jgi:DnaK suppressor protein
MAKEPAIDAGTARALLKDAREKAESSLTDLDRLRRGDHEEAAEETDQADRGERIEEAEVDGALERRLRKELDAIERAEQRLEDGTYGFSIDSGEQIPAERLKAIPWAERTATEER